MSAATAAAAGAAASASFSASNQSRKKTEKCKATINGFDSDNASTKQMQEYAECVSVLHPKDIDVDDFAFLGVSFLVVFFVMILINKFKCGGDHDLIGVFVYSAAVHVFLVMIGVLVLSLI